MLKFSPTRDKNEPEIIRALEAVGAFVTKLHEGGVPDLLCGWRGGMHLLEVKGPLGVKGGKHGAVLTDAQVEWHERWTAAGCAVHIVRSVEEALTVIGVCIIAPGLWQDGDKLATYPQAKKKSKASK